MSGFAQLVSTTERAKVAVVIDLQPTNPMPPIRYQG